MIGSNYKIHKDNVIDLFNGYKSKRGELSDGIDIDSLESRIDSLKKDKYTLAVAGEVKAGKSTFINALLGSEILPADVLQATSAIVEIFKSDKSFLKVKYANGETEEIFDDLSTPDIDEAKERLHDICRISDEYREIPTNLIDEYIINNDETIKVDNDFIGILESEASISLKGQEELLKKYLDKRTKDNIPLEIQFGYPMKWNFDELRIVDSPGVNASGGVQKTAFDYFQDANAILFVHPIKPVESETLRKFVNNIISNRSRETLFLVLTHSSFYPESDIEKLHNEAIRLYEDFIPKDRILVVDSILKLIYNDFENGIIQEEIENMSEQKEDALAKFEKKSKKLNKNLKSVLLDYSGFEKMFSTINQFSMMAPNFQLQEILESIRDGYKNQEEQYFDKLNILHKKKKNPQEFEIEIDRINKALEGYEVLSGRTTDELFRSYTGKHTDWQEYFDKMRVKYPELITKADNFELVKKNMIEGINEINKTLNDFSKNLTIDLSKRLEETGKKFKAEHNVTVPKIDLKSLEMKAKEEAFRNEPIYESRKHNILKFWKWGNRDYEVKVGEKEVYDKDQHLNSFKTVCNKDFYKLINNLPDKSEELLKKYLESFFKEIKAVVKERQDALENEKKNKQTNEEIIQRIEEIDELKKQIPPELHKVLEILEDIK